MKTLTLSGGLVLALFWAGCGGHGDPHGTHPPLPAVAAPTTRAEAATQPRRIELSGTLRARERAVVAAQVSGNILTLAVEPGDTVRVGQVLATLAADQYRARLLQAQAEETLAASTQRRLAALRASDAATPAELEAAEARLQVARSNLTEAQTLLGYTTITAPFDAVVTRKLATAGDLATPGRALLELENPASLEVEVEVPESLAPFAASGTTLRATVSGQPPVAVVIREVAPAADPIARTVLVRAPLPEVSPAARSGQFVRVELTAGEQTLLAVPATALVRQGQLEFVFTVEGAAPGTARLRLVRSGPTLDGGRVAILAGLVAGEAIVAAPPASLRDATPLQ